MKKITLWIIAVCFASCAVSNETNQLKTRRADDLAIYGNAPSRPDRPVPARIKRKTPNTPTALCNDDNFSFSRNVDFTCTGHGGVKEWTYDTDTQITPDDARYFED